MLRLPPLSNDMKNKLLLAVITLAVFPAIVFAQIDASSTIPIPSGFTDQVFLLVGNLFALNSIGGIVAVIVGVLLAFIAIEMLVNAIRHRG
jgi:hypothetical protein